MLGSLSYLKETQPVFPPSRVILRLRQRGFEMSRITRMRTWSPPSITRIQVLNVDAIFVPLKNHQKLIETPGLRRENFVTIKLIFEDKEDNMITLILDLKTIPSMT